ALFHRLIVLENLLQSLKAAALVYEGNAAVVWSYIICRVACVYARAGSKIERRAARGASDPPASWRATVAVLFVAEVMVVICSVIALASKERLQAVLSINVHRQKLLAILTREVIK